MDPTCHNALLARVEQKVKNRPRNLPTGPQMASLPQVNTSSGSVQSQGANTPSAPVPSPKTITSSGLVQLQKTAPIQTTKSSNKLTKAVDFKMLTIDNFKKTASKATPEFFKSAHAMAAYCGITDRATFHRLRFSWIMLKLYPAWLCYLKGKGFLSLLHDEIEDEAQECTDNDEFPNRTWDIMQKYPHNVGDTKAHRTNQDYGLASIIRTASMSFRRVNNSKGDPDALLQQINKLQSNAWVMTKKCPQAFPDPPPELFEWDVSSLPDLGPFPKELLIERYNRVNLLFHSLRYVLTPSKTKDHKLLDPSRCTLFTKSEQIALQSWPYWMRPAQNQKVSSARPLQFLPKNFTIHWARKSGTAAEKSALEYHLTDEDGHVESEGLSIPPVDSRINTDPRLCQSGAQWRDCIRAQYDLWKLKLNLTTLDILFPNNDKVNIFGKSDCMSWVDAMKFFEKETHVAIQMKLVPISDEVEHPIIEWDGPPPQVSSFIEVDEECRVQSAQVNPDQSEIDPLNETIGLPVGVEAITGPFAETEGYDLADPSQFSEFQQLVFNDPRITDQTPPQDIKTDDLFKAKASKEQKSFFKDTNNDHSKAVLNEDNDGDEDLGTLLPKSPSLSTIQNAFMTSGQCNGPCVEDARLLLGMVPAGSHLDTGLPVFTCSLLPKCKVRFLDTQITAAAFMISKSFGCIPTCFAQGKDTDAIKSARNRLECPATYGVILAEGTGMGKTLASLLALELTFEAICSMQKAQRKSKNVPVTIKQSQTCLEEIVGFEHFPSILICPSSLVLTQWVKQIRTDFPGINIIISADAAPPEVFLQKLWVSSTQMKNPATKWPMHLDYIFDTTDPMASRTVIITLPGTHSSRCLQLGRTSKAKDWESFTSWWTGKFRIVIVDEAHKLRHNDTKFWQSVWKLKAVFHWLITASPMVNTEKDIIALLQFGWPSIRRSIPNDKEVKDWYNQQKDPNHHDIIANSSELQGRIVLAALNPKAIESLFRSDSLATKAERFAIVSKLIMISRSRGSTLQMNVDDSSAILDLAPIMKDHVVRTLDIKLNGEEEVESQFWHLLNAREYDITLQNSIPDAPGKAARDRSKKTFPAITAPLRRLSIASASTKLARLDHVLARIGFSSLVDSMDAFRHRKVGIDWFIRLVWKEADGAYPQTRRDQLAFLTQGSPLCRWLFSEYRDYGIGAKKKLLLIEDVPFIAWYWEVMSKAIGINVHVMYSSTSSIDRQSAMDAFNKKGSTLQVLVLLYSVGGAHGTNLDEDCSRALVMNVGLNSQIEIQAWARLIQISQKDLVVIKRAVVQNTHSQTREARQMDKSVVQLACRTGAGPVRDVLVALLNKYNHEIKEAQAELRSSVSPLDDSNPPIIEEEPEKKTEEAYEEPLAEDDGILDETSSQRALRDNEMTYETLDPVSDNEDEDKTYRPNHDDEDQDDNDKTGTQPMPEEFEELLEAQGVSKSSLRGQLKQQYIALTLAGKMEYDNVIDSEWTYLRLLSHFDPDKVYKLKDLDDNEVLERGIRLLYRERYGMKREFLRIGIHIQYTKMSTRILQRFQEDLRMTKSEMAKKAAAAGIDLSVQKEPAAQPDTAGKKRKSDAISSD